MTKLDTTDRTVTLHEDKKSKVVAMYYLGELLYTKTYVLDDEGAVDKSITVFPDGGVVIQ